jgi:hypothetical protein
MPRNITVTFADGSQHVYDNAPDDVTPEAVSQRAQQEFGKSVTALDGGRKPTTVPVQDKGFLDSLDDVGRNVTAGAVRGVGSLVAKVRDAGRTVGQAVPPNMRPNVGQPTLSSLITGDTRQDDTGAQFLERLDKTMRDTVGADPDSASYQVGKVGGEVAATAPVGGVMGRALAALGLGKLGAATASGGLSLGARTAPGVANAVKDAGIRALGGALNGGASTALVAPAEDVPTGAAIGAVTPGVLKLAGKGGQVVGQAVSGRLAQNAAVRKVVEAVGDDAVPQAVGDIQTYHPRGAENIPVSAAAATQNPALARLEQGSRLRSGDAWYGFDQAPGRAVHDNVQLATSEADQLAARAREPAAELARLMGARRRTRSRACGASA